MGFGKKFGFVMLVALASVPVLAQQPQPNLTLRSGIRFKGDEFDGLETGPKVSRTGKHYVALIASQPNASPPPVQIAATVTGLVNAYLTHHPERYPSFVAPGAKSYVGSTFNPSHEFIPDGFPLEFKGKITANTPYYLVEMTKANLGFQQWVRVEWLSDGQLAAISVLTLVDGKVVEVITSGDHPPPLPRSAFDPPPERPTQDSIP